MSELPAAVRSKLAKALRLLSSDRDGEVLSAAHTVARVLRAVGSDIHTLSDLIEHGNGGQLSEAEMKKLYDAGYADGRADGVRAAEAKLHHDQDGFRDIDGIPSWHEVAIWCQRRSERLRETEAGFLDDMAGRTVYSEPTPKQEKWLRSIYLRLGGGRLPS